MFVRLTRAKRLDAGRFVALVYLLCVLAPTLSFALPGSRAVSPCLTEAAHVPGIVQMHTDAPIQHVRVGDHVHDHAKMRLHTSSGDDRSASTAGNSRPVPEKSRHSCDGQCCGLMCVIALPAALVDI